MSVMTIVACKIFEDEMVWLMQRDPSFENVIADNGEVDRFCEKLDACGVSYKRVPEAAFRDAGGLPSEFSGGCARVFWIMPFALHAVVKKLKEGVYEKIREVRSYSDAVFLMYGLCGNALLDVENDLSDDVCPVVILRDNDGVIADDCIGALVGGRRVYSDMLKGFRGVGTFIMMPKWSACWRDIAVASGFSDHPENTEMMGILMEMANYRQVMKLETGLMYEPNFDENIKEFSNIFGFDILTHTGNQDMVLSCYERVRKIVLKDDV